MFLSFFPSSVPAPPKRAEPGGARGVRGGRVAVSGALVGVQCPCGLARFGEVRAAQRLVLVRAQAFLRLALSQFSPRLYIGSRFLWYSFILQYGVCLTESQALYVTTWVTILVPF